MRSGFARGENEAQTLASTGWLLMALDEVLYAALYVWHLARPQPARGRARPSWAILVHSWDLLGPVRVRCIVLVRSERKHGDYYLEIGDYQGLYIIPHYMGIVRGFCSPFYFNSSTRTSTVLVPMKLHYR